MSLFALRYTRADGVEVAVRVEAGTVLAIFEGDTCVRYKVVHDVEAGIAEARGYAMGDLEALAKQEAGRTPNQCDGCNLGLPVDKNGHHYWPDRTGWERLHGGCTRDRYEPKAEAAHV